MPPPMPRSEKSSADAASEPLTPDAVRGAEPFLLLAVVVGCPRLNVPVAVPMSPPDPVKEARSGPWMPVAVALATAPDAVTDTPGICCLLAISTMLLFAELRRAFAMATWELSIS